MGTDAEGAIDCCVGIMWSVVNLAVVGCCSSGGTAAAAAATSIPHPNEQPEDPTATTAANLRDALTPEEEGKLTSRRCPGCPCTVQVRSTMKACV